MARNGGWPTSRSVRETKFWMIPALSFHRRHLNHIRFERRRHSFGDRTSGWNRPILATKERPPVLRPNPEEMMEIRKRIRGTRIWGTAVALMSVLVFSKCGGDGKDGGSGDPGDLSARTALFACGDSIAMEDQMSILDGSLVLASRHSRDANLNNLFLGQFLLGFILNGVDLDVKDQNELTFRNNAYRYGKQGHYGTLAFVFSKDYRSFKAGDTVPYDIFDLKTYIPKFDVSLSGVDIKEKGPLFDLVDISWRMAGLTPKFSIRYPDLRTIGISIGSIGSYAHAYPDTATKAEGDSLVDSLTLVMSTPAETFFDIYQRITDRSFEIDYASTTYHSNFYSLDQVFGGSAIRIYQAGKSAWQFDGKYHAELRKKGKTYYLEGYLSNHDGNYTRYYCDAERTDLLGTARHDGTLLFGIYYPKSGGRLPYLIMPF
jgi:hypothetical protein